MLGLHGDRRRTTTRAVAWFIASALLTAPHTTYATTYISAEPVPNKDVVGEEHLAKIRGIGYSRLERWSQRLLSECRVVDQVIETLSLHGAISTVTPGNTRFVVAAGGFEAATNPSYVFTVQDQGSGSASAADVDVLDNALGYVLNQGGTAHFSPDNAKAYAFPDGDGYLVNIGDSPQLLDALAALRQQHLNAVAMLLEAIDRGNVDAYLDKRFSCPN